VKLAHGRQATDASSFGVFNSAKGRLLPICTSRSTKNDLPQVALPFKTRKPGTGSHKVSTGYKRSSAAEARPAATGREEQVAWGAVHSENLVGLLAAEGPLLLVQRPVVSQDDEWQDTASAVIQLQNLSGCCQPSRTVRARTPV